MEWFLWVVVVAGWIVGFVILDRLTMWLVIRAGWTFHTMKEGSYLKMNDGAQDRFNWEDEKIEKD